MLMMLPSCTWAPAAAYILCVIICFLRCIACYSPTPDVPVARLQWEQLTGLFPRRLAEDQGWHRREVLQAPIWQWNLD
eukprot:43541-Eustigmatos_ZCMA.PRE.1